MWLTVNVSIRVPPQLGTAQAHRVEEGVEHEEVHHRGQDKDPEARSRRHGEALPPEPFKRGPRSSTTGAATVTASTNTTLALLRPRGVAGAAVVQ